MKMLLLAGTALLGLAASEPAAHAQRVDFTYTGNLVTFTVPKTGTYQIIAFGAQGGSGSRPGAVGISRGGRGAEIGGNFNLTAGDTLQIAVGGAGSDGGGGGGGGGGSFVVGPGNTPLVIAGGGGGGGGTGFLADVILLPGQGGLTGPDGGFTSNIINGGTGGNGGGAGPQDGGGGGGGFFSAGGNNGFTATGGGAFPGLAGGPGSGSVGGGFGGGGGASFGAGGGGGYSGGGGGGGSPGTSGPGGGGGSFDAGTDQILVADIWPGNGEVIIMEVSPAFAGTPGKANCRGKSISALAKQYGGLNNAAAALGFDSVDALQRAIEEFCVA